MCRARDEACARRRVEVLSPSFAGDPERLGRFEREAKTLASLTHPHIAQIHSFQRSGETSALAMELVEGEDLAQRMAGCHSDGDSVSWVGG